MEAAGLPRLNRRGQDAIDINRRSNVSTNSPSQSREPLQIVRNLPSDHRAQESYRIAKIMAFCRADCDGFKVQVFQHILRLDKTLKSG
jgi:hypothetical protein